jgi:hypothetical protein
MAQIVKNLQVFFYFLSTIEIFSSAACSHTASISHEIKREL